ncbi:CLUMA_CG018318, isoform A [Clunio marinus]|uniref:CLUMA_CG018318, isoform A n=1 Tax=Clunio marinus TaxID=568069 RepID=A0A1J1J0D6_9DIPT|nr:CLUMA_CG018318, isoform A [Clunio marinus]
MKTHVEILKSRIKQQHNKVSKHRNDARVRRESLLCVKNNNMRHDDRYSMVESDKYSQYKSEKEKKQKPLRNPHLNWVQKDERQEYENMIQPRMGAKPYDKGFKKICNVGKFKNKEKSGKDFYVIVVGLETRKERHCNIIVLPIQSHLHAYKVMC